MKIKFTKMQSCGNDYVYIDCIAKDGFDFDSFSASQIKNLVVRLSTQHYGIGSDGVIFICKSTVADAKMRMFNADGSEGRMCGNGIRCVAKYVYDNHSNLITNPSGNKNLITIETLSGIKEIIINKAQITVKMGSAEFEPAKIPVKINKEMVINYPLKIGSKGYKITCVSMGNPHCVVFVDNVDAVNLARIGPKFEHHKVFPERVNTEFVEVINETTLKMRVWERGSGETLACGTGACAAVMAALMNSKCKFDIDIKVILKGGELIINYTDGCVLMTGDAQKVFEGVIEI
ncbi:MAG: diaminopimelate epimerase [Firmicutes bacterium]|nr:diaminopimelate epimerase [Bacillota bacterium]